MTAALVAIAANVKSAAIASLNQSARVVMERARSKAPVRNIFDGGRRKVRFRTSAEVLADRRVFRQFMAGSPFRPELIAPPSRRAGTSTPSYARTTLGTGRAANTSFTDTANTWAASSRRRLRGVDGLRYKVATMNLHARGRSEVKTGRADYKGRVGGRLRGEIRMVPATRMAPQARVISPTPYARYQEFGTRRHAAQPFLRPALRESRSEIVSAMRAAVRGAISGERVEVTIEI